VLKSRQTVVCGFFKSNLFAVLITYLVNYVNPVNVGWLEGSTDYRLMEFTECIQKVNPAGDYSLLPEHS